MGIEILAKVNPANTSRKIYSTTKNQLFSPKSGETDIYTKEAIRGWEYNTPSTCTILTNRYIDTIPDNTQNTVVDGPLLVSCPNLVPRPSIPLQRPRRLSLQRKWARDEDGRRDG
jgi:hypothetical protein